jgi:hypothetical protein
MLYFSSRKHLVGLFSLVALGGLAILLPSPVFSQTTPVTAKGTDSCFGFFCNVVTRLIETDDFKPFGSTILCIAKISNGLLAFYLVTTVAKIFQKRLTIT